MAKRPSSTKTPKAPAEIDPELPGDIEPGTIDDPEAYEAAKAAGTIAEVRPPRPPTKVLPDRTPQLHAKRAFLASATDPVVVAFLHMENLRKETRKMSRDEWLAELDRFKKAPR